MRVLDGVRVVDLSEGPVVGLATMILADFGAEVVKVEPPGGDPFRTDPAAELWLRGKRSLAWDPADAASTHDLQRLVLQTSEAMMTSWPERELARHGLDAATLRGARPDLVVCEVSAFGRDNRYSHLPLHEGLVAARAGRMMSFRGLVARDGPVYSAVPVATHATSQSAAAGVLAALFRRASTGQGAHLSTSLLRGLLPYEMGGLLALQLDERNARVTETPDPFRTMPSINYHPVRCRDGRWLQLGNLLPHLLARFFALTGLDADLDDPAYQKPPISWPPDLLERLRDRLLERMQTRTAEEWMHVFVTDGGVVAHPYQTTQEALDDPDIAANGHVVAQGSKRQLGVLARLDETPGHASFVVPAPGSATRRELAHKPLVPAGAGPKRAALLTGVTVVEFATIIAAPFGAAALADLGARVIKVEPLEGDPFRAMGGGLGAARVNTGKESVQVDLKQPAGQRIARELIERADILIHNYRSGVPEKLGIGWEDARRINPRLVYVSVNGYGPAGPGALRPSTHPIPGAALGGVLHQLGGAPPRELAGRDAVRETARRLSRANEVNPDPNTSMVVATAALLGLVAAARHGGGQPVFVDMFGANAYANFDDFLAYPGKPDRRTPDPELLGLGPLYRLYRCRTGWVFLAAELPDEEARLRNLLAELGHPIDRLDAVEAVFASADADWWEARCLARDVGCVRADVDVPSRFLRNDALARSEALVEPARHAEWGTYLRHGAMVRDAAPAPLRGACVAGEHTRAVLSELGYAPDDVEDLIEARVAAAGTVY